MLRISLYHSRVSEHFNHISQIQRKLRKLNSRFALEHQHRYAHLVAGKPVKMSYVVFERGVREYHFFFSFLSYHSNHKNIKKGDKHWSLSKYLTNSIENSQTLLVKNPVDDTIAHHHNWCYVHMFLWMNTQRSVIVSVPRHRQEKKMMMVYPYVKQRDYYYAPYSNYTETTTHAHSRRGIILVIQQLHHTRRGSAHFTYLKHVNTHFILKIRIGTSIQQ